MLTKKKRSIVFAKYNGRCAYCGCELQKGWHVDHLKPINRYSESVRDERGFVVSDENYNVKKVVKIGRPENDVLENKTREIRIGRGRREWGAEPYTEYIVIEFEGTNAE